jgi:GTP cyclohydrolase I
MAVDEARAREAVRELLAACGLDPDSPQFARTPARVAAAAGELFSGVGADAVTPLVEGRISLEEPSEASESAAASQAVLLRNIRFRSMCEHHLLPFDGWVQLAYLPGDSIIGFGRLYDLVETLSSRPTLQEKLGDDLVDAVMTGLDARGAIAVLEARQGCVADRGPRQADSETVTFATRGAFNNPDARAEVLRLIALGATDRGE